MRILSPKSAQKLKGEVGSTASTAIFLFKLNKCPIRALTKLLLPAPGGPVKPITGTDRLNGKASKRALASG
jgi:hypothetical protein